MLSGSKGRQNSGISKQKFRQKSLKKTEASKFGGSVRALKVDKNYFRETRKVERKKIT